MATVANSAAPVTPNERPYRFTVGQYHRMIATGVLTENDRVELIEGQIVPKMTHNPPHDASVDLTQTAIAAVLPEGWRVRVQSAITLTTAGSEPEPDVAVVRGPARRYNRSHPRPRDIALLVEVADATLPYDRTTKHRLYARARIPVYWIVNLIDSCVEVYTLPRAGQSPAYRQREDYSANEAVPVILEGREIARLLVQELLP
jgi:Uma2 family endonuclease